MHSPGLSPADGFAIVAVVIIGLTICVWLVIQHVAFLRAGRRAFDMYADAMAAKAADRPPFVPAQSAAQGHRRP
jgi:hypothetical protein